MTDRTWVLMPIAGAQDYTDNAIADVLAQSVPVRLLLINQGVDTEFRRHLERIAESHEEDVLLWSHDPPLPSLAATWNRGLRCVWESGGIQALVVNNDVRLHGLTCWALQCVLARERALFVSAVGVTPDQFEGPDTARAMHDAQWTDLAATLPRGGPDFSCFLISKECHDKYAFDEGFCPAFCEDLDYHRRLMLGGDGERIFSVNLPYLHYGSQTLKKADPARRASIERQIERVSRAHYLAKWGGPVNGERFTIPFDAETAQDGVTTPELQCGIPNPV